MALEIGKLLGHFLLPIDHLVSLEYDLPLQPDPVCCDVLALIQVSGHMLIEGVVVNWIAEVDLSVHLVQVNDLLVHL